MSTTEGREGSPAVGGQETSTQKLRTLFRQNSEKVGIVAENVVLPRNKRSIKLTSAAPENIALDVESQQTYSVTKAGPQIPAKEFPIFMILISITQAILFYYGGDYTWLLLGYDPYRRHEIWRYLTIMFVHSSASHLWGNVIFQLILGVLLEIVHHWKRIGLIYICGVLGGSVAITVLEPNNYGVGASAGVYALLTAHLATIIINWNEMDNKCCRVFWLLFYITFDIGINVYVEIGLGKDTRTSHAGHLGGAVTGFLVAIFILRNFEKHPWERVFQKICAGTIVALLVITIIVNFSLPSHYFKSEFNTDYERTFVEYTFNIIAENGEDSEVWKTCQQEKECWQMFEQYRHNGTLNLDSE